MDTAYLTSLEGWYETLSLSRIPVTWLEPPHTFECLASQVLHSWDHLEELRCSEGLFCCWIRGLGMTRKSESVL